MRRPLTNLEVLCLPHARTHRSSGVPICIARGTAHAPETCEVNHEAVAIFAQRRPDAEASNHAHSICAMRGMRLSARRTPKHAWHFTWWRDRHEHECEHVLKELDPLARRRVPWERSVCLQALDSRPLDVGPICVGTTRARGRSEERESVWLANAAHRSSLDSSSGTCDPRAPSIRAGGACCTAAPNRALRQRLPRR